MACPHTYTSLSKHTHALACKHACLASKHADPHLYTLRSDKHARTHTRHMFNSCMHACVENSAQMHACIHKHPPRKCTRQHTRQRPKERVPADVAGEGTGGKGPHSCAFLDQLDTHSLQHLRAHSSRQYYAYVYACMHAWTHVCMYMRTLTYTHAYKYIYIT
jgi:hypothetical protein